MKKNYITITRRSSPNKEEYFHYTKLQWDLAWLAVFVAGIMFGAMIW